MLKQSPYFHSLTLNSRRALIQSNLYLTSCLNAKFVSREVDLWSNTDLGLSYNAPYDADYFTQFPAVPKRMDPKSTLHKLLLSTIFYGSKPDSDIECNTLECIHVQDELATLL